MKVKYEITKKMKEEFELALDETVAHTVNKLFEKKLRIEKEIKAYVEGWFADIPVLTDDNLYFKILDEYRCMILTSRWDRDRVKHSADEMVRRAWCNQSFYTFEQLVGFYKRYAEVKKELYNYMPLWNAELDKGDDGYGDFIDSIQMVSFDLPQRILNGEFTNQDEDDGRVNVEQLRREYDRAAQEAEVNTIGREKLADYWWNGENYNAFLLIQRLEEIAPHYINDIVDIVALTEDEA